MGGKGQKCKDIGNVVSKCRKHHREFEDTTIQIFQDKYKVNLHGIARSTGIRWRREKARREAENG